MLTAACHDVRPQPLRVPAGAVPRTVLVKAAGRAAPLRVPLEEYVQAAILSEFAPPTGDPADVQRMLEVQAVIARTYAAANAGRHRREGFDLCATTHCQLYEPGRLRTSSWAPLAVEAAARTASQVLWYNGAPASAVFHADCGGHTSAARDVWTGTPRSYLPARADDGDAGDAHVSWRFEATTAELLEALNSDARTRIGTSLRDIKIVERDAAGRATLLVVSGTREPVVRGEEFRAVVTRAFGVRTLRSTRFEISRTRRGFAFAGRGYGHGVGLCQVGAYARLKAGARPEQVLARYYPGTRLILLR
jgi:stage II sporulation protein D